MKTLQRISVLVTVMSFVGFQGFSQNASGSDVIQNSPGSQTATNFTPGKFVDNNKDGICDNYQGSVKSGQGRNFVDKNGDGTCDNRQNAGKKKGNPNCCGMGHQHRHGQGNGNCCGRGYGYQHRHGNWNQNNPASDPQKSDTDK
ncbi:MAG: hypothetical protein NTU98_13205 [Bacteroidetes bacterium]|nr:hypothetical protein [Bacteroidota bacterium]